MQFCCDLVFDRRIDLLKSRHTFLVVIFEKRKWKRNKLDNLFFDRLTIFGFSNIKMAKTIWMVRVAQLAKFRSSITLTTYYCQWNSKYEYEFSCENLDMIKWIMNPLQIFVKGFLCKFLLRISFENFFEDFLCKFL